MPDHLTIVSTADGSKTIYNALVGENYHSKHGALQESKHVFVHSGLEYFLAGGNQSVGEVSILEVGFGTGLNFLLTADFCVEHSVKLNYTGIEAYPLSAGMIAQTGYDEYVSPAIWQSFLSSYPSALSNNTLLNDTCRFNVAVTQLADFASTFKFDVIYFDAFAAVHQPEMWSDEAITHTLQFLKPGGVFVTYAITGNLKRAVKAQGLKVEKAPGAPGKREMLRATLPL
ncbi:tRNA (5-methylaminomethyl-2-thiouridine)(34)-methyltransferase MnmD [Mucilaginibacter pallidiroseus]|uniref:tRNA (5-methylaminomethyl-2-thiouridine)(34)-methyltransferase MnmD n=1 Tax=Mucilaginibacter pallidiroseus TaxID=2599295 RepID=A0A563U836_9SPHI|nr:tRNA (5-methylaminomethyl-2-thiouridine)(34)-methyltransferase MnmD [Mucilaginibacter pallidiroseus]TWR27474.1 tRNA (5-methylaminomethyl-2-thiouridine)(34)-methyltransferase MnmD [Mucilaginibacter pallidiroseus]